MAKRRKRTPKKARGLATASAHSNVDLASRTSPISPSIHLASVHVFGDLDTLHEVSTGRASDWFYRRYGHLNSKLLEDCLAELEGGEQGLACASGMSAALTLFWTLTSGGDHIVAAQDIYGGTYSFLDNQMPRLGVGVSFVEPTVAAIREAVKPNTRVVFVETIGNPLVNVCDLPAVAKVAHEAGAVLMVDNTFATPALCRPHTLGADIVYHSGTKFIGGHGDALSGVATGPARLMRPARKLAITLGATVSPFDAWLTLRGLRTLPLRVSRAAENAEGVARFMERHRKVKAVHYPGLPSSPSFATAKKVLNGGYGAMLSFDLGSIKAAQTFVKQCQMIKVAPSLGDVTTTLSHPARSSHAYLSPEDREAVGVTEGLLRLSTGVEDIGDILEDLDAALKQL